MKIDEDDYIIGLQHKQNDITLKRKRGDELRVDAMKLKLLSAENGMNVQELADVSGVAFATVCKARAGKEVSERTVVKLARALQVEAVELIERGRQ